MLPLTAFGKRIIVLGPSNAGKSTLAVAISNKLSLPIVHLDQLHHLPNTDWQARPEAEFKALHDKAISSDRWVMDGNYSRLMPPRLGRATGAILLTSNSWLRLARYMKRSLSGPTARAGSLAGGPQYLKWEMIDWIVFKTPRNNAKYAKMIDKVTIPAIGCSTLRDLKALYRRWDLQQPET